MQSLLEQPLGRVMLGVIALGLFGFALWRLLQSVLDADGLGHDPQALATRGGQAISAAAHLGLGIFAASLAVGWSTGTGGDEQSARNWTRWLMAQAFGRWLVAAVRLGVMGAGLAMLRRA